jgi:hypothetical protein
MDKHVYDKTDKGREEIATRKYHLAAKLRALLVMIDGHRPLDVLMKNCEALGLTPEHLADLLKDEYIVLTNAGVEALSEAELAKGHGPSARARQATRREASARAHHHDDDGHTELAAGLAAPATAPKAAPLPSGPPMSDVERNMALREFYSQTIKSTLGLRGMLLQLKVEKCSGMDDYRQLRDVYLEAVLKAKGREMALSLSGRLDQLLGFEHGERALP